MTGLLLLQSSYVKSPKHHTHLIPTKGGVGETPSSSMPKMTRLSLASKQQSVTGMLTASTADMRCAAKYTPAKEENCRSCKQRSALPQTGCPVAGHKLSGKRTTIWERPCCMDKDHW